MPLRWPLVLLASLLLVLSAFAFVQEQSYYTAGATAEQHIEGFLNHSRLIGAASMTQSQYLRDCRNAMVSPSGRALAVPARRGLYQACFDAAVQVITLNPLSSYGWMSGAHAALALDDISTMNAFLLKSYQTGRNEGWIARLRTELVEGNLPLIDKGLLDRHQHDIAVLADSYYRDYLADIYVQRTDARERIAAAVETLPPDAQLHFVNAVDRARLRFNGTSVAQ